jgi:hypothetical protein
MSFPRFQITYGSMLPHPLCSVTASPETRLAVSNGLTRLPALSIRKPVNASARHPLPAYDTWSASNAWPN